MTDVFPATTVIGEAERSVINEVDSPHPPASNSPAKAVAITINLADRIAIRFRGHGIFFDEIDQFLL